MIRKATLAGIIFAGLMALSGCAGQTNGYNNDEQGYKQALADATAMADKAKKMNGEWRDIRWPGPKKAKAYAKTLFGKAEKAAKEGDYAKAIKLLNKAKDHAELGIKQAESQKNAGPHS